MRWDYLVAAVRAVREGPRLRGRKYPHWPGVRAAWLVAAACLAAMTPLGAGEGQIRGLPFTRSYPLEEIGKAPRGSWLTFDAFGRLALIYGGVYLVLNDTAWLDLSHETPEGGVSIVNILHAPDGRSYYCDRGSWGTVELASDGRMLPTPLVPADAPAWARANAFAEMIATKDGVYFAGPGGVAFFDPTRGEHRYFECVRLAKIFNVGPRVFVSSHRQALLAVDLERGTLREMPSTLDDAVVDCATALDDGHTLVSTSDGRLLVFDGTGVSAWEPQTRHKLVGRVSALHQLLDGGTAVAITGKGLFHLSAQGELRWSLTTPQYHRITSMATREPGVLWVAAEDAIEKVLYGNPLTAFGQRLGLPASWPVVARWNDRIVVLSGSELYQAVSGDPGVPTNFERMKSQPTGGIQAMAARGAQLLVGTDTGVLSVRGDGVFTPVPAPSDVLRLVMVRADLCYVIGRSEIGVLQWTAQGWAECAPRIPSNVEPAIAHAAKDSAWLELGANRVARVSLQAGALKLQLFTDLPWKETQWVNIGIIDHTVILTGAAGGRIFFDEQSEQRVEAPELDRLLGRSPYLLTRVQQDQNGMLWASHNHGVVTLTPRNGDFELDTATFDLSNDNYPQVHILPGNDVWISARRSLYRVDRAAAVTTKLTMQPRLVSMVDRRADVELLGRPRNEHGLVCVPFSENNLSFRFFSGTYAWRRAPNYEFRLDGGNHWTSLGTNSLLTFPELREGRHRLEVRIAESPQTAGPPTQIDFEVLPPWHRTWPAFGSYTIVGVLAIVGIARWSSRRAQRRNQMLEQLVRERTAQLEATMEKLNEETRTSATLAERDRLAGEIHDSLQQGLSGLILQLDATLKMPSVAGEIRSRLNVARNMVSFTRHEVQHAIWDMESPLLEDTELGAALGKLTALISSGTARIDIVVTGPTISLPSTTQHHLLRIAQEAITNAVRHAAARQITIRLEYRGDAVSLTITDDGVGFDPDAVLAHQIGHFGLRGLRGRARKLGGELRIDSSPGAGATIHVVVPLPSPACATVHAAVTTH